MLHNHVGGNDGWKQRKIVSAARMDEIDKAVKRLQDERATLYATIDDDAELLALVTPIQIEIARLIDGAYESREQVRARMGR